jgi:hypothetical protein
MANEGFTAINLARIYPVTSDGAQWEVKVFIKGQIQGTEVIIGEVTFRSFDGGLPMLSGMANPSIIQLVQQAIKQAVSGPTIIPASKIPEVIRQ